MVNSSPLAGQSGRWVTSRKLRERLDREERKNLAMRVEDTDSADVFTVYGRGELMLAILAETMRREGYELALGMPEVVVREVDGKRMEPLEEVVVDVPDEHIGTVTGALGERRGQLQQMTPWAAAAPAWCTACPRARSSGTDRSCSPTRAGPRC